MRISMYPLTGDPEMLREWQWARYQEELVAIDQGTHNQVRCEMCGEEVAEEDAYGLGLRGQPRYVCGWCVEGKACDDSTDESTALNSIRQQVADYYGCR